MTPRLTGRAFSHFQWPNDFAHRINFSTVENILLFSPTLSVFWTTVAKPCAFASSQVSFTSPAPGGLIPIALDVSAQPALSADDIAATILTIVCSVGVKKSLFLIHKVLRGTLYLPYCWCTAPIEQSVSPTSPRSSLSDLFTQSCSILERQWLISRSTAYLRRRIRFLWP